MHREPPESFDNVGRLRDNGLQSIDAGSLFTLERWTWTVGAVPQDRHAHTEWQLCEYLDTPGHYFHRGSCHPVAARSAAIVPPGEVHRPVDHEVRIGARYRVWYFDDRHFPALQEATGSPHWMQRRVPTVSSAAPLLLSLATMAAHPDDEGSTLLAFERLVAGLAGVSARACSDAIARTVRETTLILAKDYLFDHPDRGVPLAELARATGLSASRLSHAFTARFGISPAAFSLRLRTDRARRALLAGSTITQASSDAGFSDQAHLTRNFRRFVGPTPSAYVRAARSFESPGS